VPRADENQTSEQDFKKAQIKNGVFTGV